MSLFEDLSWRGLIAHSTDPEALRHDLDHTSMSFYVGFDPSAPSLHMGNLLQLITARRLQQAGHRPILLVGGSTGLIGDPRQSSERNLNPADLVASWVERLRAMVAGYVSFDGDNAAIVVNNYDWTANMTALEFLRDIGKHFSVNRMLDREVVKTRLESGISFTEFSYVLLQSMDYLHLHREYGATLETGGSDQWGNITAGVELIRRVTGDKVHAMATPLVTKADGTKYGKTESGTVWLDPTMTSPYAFYQFFLNAEDSMVVSLLRLFTQRSHDQIDELERQTQESPHLRAAQRALADDLTDLVHGEEQRRAVTQAASAVFGQAEFDGLDAAIVSAVVEELPRATWPDLDGRTVLDALADSGVFASRGAAKRAVSEGGAYLNNQRVLDPERALSAADLVAGGVMIVRRGKKTVGAIQVTGAPV
ncbi:MAG: tyrosine--tRNA ligase [Propionibacteriaceae bacterium]|jgi:tyrosyl-tRNA synthetase|nr:tyrosine--tRNA ligase [Propionibacteriaceae bacterium]